MRIRSEQRAAFSSQALDDFVERIIRYLARAFPNQITALGMSRVDLDRFVLDGIERARGFGVINKPDVKRFVECMVVLGPRFDDDASIPWAGEILRRRNLSGERKMDRIDAYRIFALDEPI